ncbi:MAG: protein-export chaperone SecB [Desulfonauticus sp.]|nr:protein-export chaperone SecB [Desulfonauticus sp.]
MVEEGKLEKEVEEKLVKYQIPALLFPYLRGTITSFLSNAGFASVILPLINIYALAKDYLSDMDIEIID